MNNLTVNLMVTDVNESVSFYSDVLGFKLEMSVPEEGVFNWAMVTNDQISIMFQEENNLKEEYPCFNENPVTPCFTMYIKVDDIESLYNDLKDKTNIALDYHKTFYGSYEFAVTDNNGYVLTFAQ